MTEHWIVTASTAYNPKEKYATATDARTAAKALAAAAPGKQFNVYRLVKVATAPVPTATESDPTT